MYHGNFTEADRAIVETIYDAMKKEEKKLSKQAKNSDVNMFAQNIFPKVLKRLLRIVMYSKWMPLQNSSKNPHSMVK